jgi:hypothetical protein
MACTHTIAGSGSDVGRPGLDPPLLRAWLRLTGTPALTLVLTWCWPRLRLGPWFPPLTHMVLAMTPGPVVGSQPTNAAERERPLGRPEQRHNRRRPRVNKFIMHATPCSPSRPPTARFSQATVCGIKDEHDRAPPQRVRAQATPPSSLTPATLSALVMVFFSMPQIHRQRRRLSPS